MLKGTFKEIVLQVMNIGLGVVAVAMMARGFFVSDGLAGLGLALLMTSGICAVAFKYGIEQRLQGATQASRTDTPVGLPRVGRVPSTLDPTG